MSKLLVPIAFLFLVGPACGSSRETPSADAAAGGGDASGDGDGDGDSFQPLIRGDWELAPVDEGYRCVYKTLEETMYVRAFRPVIPDGTHHTVLTMGPKAVADGISSCNAGTNYNTQVFGSGVGTNSLTLPDGMAVKLEAGQQLLLNLHLFNANPDSALTGTSGTDVVVIPESEVETVVDAFMVSKFNLSIDPGVQTQSGTCTVSQEMTLYSAMPHMHQMGSHMKVVAETAASGNIVLWDRDYDFDQQIVELLDDPVALQPGDRLHIDCTYTNTTEGEVTWGDSSNAEMCISGHFRAPAGGGLFCTTD